MAAELQMRSVWVIHESWPQDQLDYYAKDGGEARGAVDGFRGLITGICTVLM